MQKMTKPTNNNLDEMQELQLQGKHARLSEESQKQLEELNHY